MEVAVGVHVKIACRKKIIQSAVLATEVADKPDTAVLPEVMDVPLSTGSFYATMDILSATNA